MRIAIRPHPAAVQVEIAGDIADKRKLWEFSAALEMAAELKRPYLVLDLQRAEIITSAGVSLLGMVDKSDYPWGGHYIRVIEPSRTRRWTLVLFKVYENWRPFPNLQAALEDINQDLGGLSSA